MSDPKPHDYTLLHTKRITRSLFVAILERAQSPAAPIAADCYDICLRAGVDPAVALAFFEHESSYGTKGAARVTLNWGNLRASQGRAYKVAEVPGSRGPFAYYRSWRDSCADFCQLLIKYDRNGAGRQVGTRLQTVRAALVEYAPSDDGNSPTSYAQKVIDNIYKWSQAIPLPEPAPPVATPDPWVRWGNAYPLPVEQREWGIPQLWLANAPWLGAATSHERYVDERTSIQTFEGGWIVYESANGTTHLGRRTKL